jgi:NAD+ kinase
MRVTLFTHRRASQVREAIEAVREMSDARGIELRFDAAEAEKHGLDDAVPVEPDVDLCLVFGGDGTILHALRTYADTGVPVFGVNFGEVGFLAAVDREHWREGIERALDGRFERLGLPGIDVENAHGDRWTAINDVSLHRRAGMRVADLAYSVADDEVGRVRCDGLVVATPAGSTGYNLANGGPVMAWGVEGIAVSFIAPHSLTARSLVVAPRDTVTISNRSREESVDVTVDGRPIGEVGPDEWVRVAFRDGRATLAQLPGANFYHRLRQKFGRLATGV